MTQIFSRGWNSPRSFTIIFILCLNIHVTRLVTYIHVELASIFENIFRTITQPALQATDYLKKKAFMNDLLSHFLSSLA